MMNVKMYYPECEHCLYWQDEECNYEDLCPHHPEDERIEEDEEEEQQL